MKCFIAGGAGFVGQHLADYLTAQGHTVRIYDRNLPKHGSGFCGDIKDLELLMQAMRGFEVVYHLASNPDISKSAIEPTIDFYEGTLLTQNILEAMRITGVHNLVYFSGSGVYGDHPGKVYDEGHGPLLPISTYGASKLAGEALICSYVHMFGINARVLRPANIVGGGQTHGVCLDFMRQLIGNPHRLRILGDGTQSKSYIHISDVLASLPFIEKWERHGFQVFNIATGDFVTVRDIAEITIKTMRCDGASMEFTGGDRGWKGDVPHISLSCAKLNRLGWVEKLTSRQAVTEAIKALKHEIVPHP